MDAKLFLEYLPAFRRIGCLERAIEHLLSENGEEQPITSRRTTRRQAKTARHHYFDKLAGQHRSDDLPNKKVPTSGHRWRNHFWFTIKPKAFLKSIRLKKELLRRKL